MKVDHLSDMPRPVKGQSPSEFFQNLHYWSLGQAYPHLSDDDIERVYHRCTALEWTSAWDADVLARKSYRSSPIFRKRPK